jgi:predicted RND superfamily exporter protein
VDNYITWILTRPRLVIACVISISIFFGYYGSSVKMDNTIEVWLPSHHSTLDEYHHFLEEFGSEEFILIALKHPSGLTRDYMRLTARFTHALEKEKGVEKVFSLSQVYERSGLDFESCRQYIVASPLYHHTLISPDGKTSALILQLSREGLDNRQGLVEGVKELVASLSTKDQEIFLAGPPVFNVALDQMSQRVSTHYFPLLFCVALIILFLLFRTVVGVLLPAIMMGLSLLLTIGWMGVWGGSLNMVTIALFPLMMVISLAYTIYLLNGYHAARRAQKNSITADQKKEMITASLTEVWFPIFLSGVTTGIGFASLTVSEVVPVKNLGFFAAVSIASTFVLVISFLPAALLLFPVPPLPSKREREHKRFTMFLQGLSRFAVQRKWEILTFCLILCVASFGGITQIKAETQALRFFKEKSPLAQAYAFIESTLTGLSPIEIVIESKSNRENALLLTNDIVQQINSLQDFLSDQEGVVCSQSVVAMREMRGLTTGEADGSMQGYLNQKKNATRVSVKAKTMGSSEYQLLINKIDRYLNEHFSGEVRAYTTGIVPLIIDMQDTLLKSLIESFSLALGVIGLIFFLLLRSFKNTLICMIPNVIPILVVLGCMGYAGIKLDVATVMIASVALGIAVDDTIHFIYRFKKEASGSASYTQPIFSTLSSTGKAIICTSMVNLCGFSVLCFSDFRPMIYFGLLTGITILAALVGDLIILPASLVAFKVKFK